MIKKNQKIFNRIQVFLDACVLIFAYWFAWCMRFRSGWFIMDEWYFSLREYMKLLILIVPEYLILYYLFHLYAPKRVLGRRLEAWRIFQANVIGVMILILILYVTKQSDVSRHMLFVFLCSNIMFETLSRNILRVILRKIRKNGYNQKHIILVGYSRATEQYIDRISANPEWGYSVRGILDNHNPIGTNYKGVKIIGELEDLQIILSQNSLDEIAITLGLSEYGCLEKIVSLCEKSGIHTKFIPDYNNIIPTKPYTEDMQGLPVINIRHVPLLDPLNCIIKRLIDIFGSIVAILLFSPIMLIIVVLMKVTDPGPIIYKQERIGWKNRPFYMYKFRSMIVQDECDEEKRWTVKNDPRVTPLGRFMRRTSIDELPQLFNVLKGEMSLVGPRPERPQFVQSFKEEIPRYMVKHQVRPGITGWAQVHGYRGDTSIKKRIEFDLYYIENWTVGLDFKIIFMTFFKGFINKNAY